METIELQQVLPAVFSLTPPVGSDIWMREVELRRGGRYLIEAASGTGKSSLCSYLYGYRNDYSGRILFDRQDAAGWSVGRWSDLRRRHVAMMFQDLRLFPELSALENIAIKNHITGHKSDAQISTLFDELGIGDKRDSAVAKLSFGQQQRVAFIRTLCQPADFIILDEPVSHLDPANAEIMTRLLDRETRESGAGIIVTSIGKRPELSYDKTFTL